MGMDTNKYQELIYQGAIVDKIDIDDLNEVMKLLSGHIDLTEFKKRMDEGLYIKKLYDNNVEVWGKYQATAVPTFVYDEKSITAVPHIGVSEEALRNFLATNVK
jgi:predicted DsbA family dithiol-disulfide isomerase